MTNRNRLIMGSAAALGMTALLFGLSAQAPARADDRDHIYRDVQDVRRDERRLSSLEARRDEARRCHRWEEARDLDREVRDLRRHIDQDRRDIRHDVNRDRDAGYRSDTRYRDDNRYRNDARYRDDTRYRDDARYRDDNRYRDDYRVRYDR